MFTPPQLSDEEDEECIEESGNAIYERQMLPKKHVFFFNWTRHLEAKGIPATFVLTV